MLFVHRRRNTTTYASPCQYRFQGSIHNFGEAQTKNIFPMEVAALSVEIKQCSQNYPVARLLLKGFSFAVKENYHEDTEMRKKLFLYVPRG